MTPDPHPPTNNPITNRAKHAPTFLVGPPHHMTPDPTPTNNPITNRAKHAPTFLVGPAAPEKAGTCHNGSRSQDNVAEYMKEVGVGGQL